MEKYDINDAARLACDAYINEQHGDGGSVAAWNAMPNLHQRRWRRAAKAAIKHYMENYVLADLHDKGDED